MLHELVVRSRSKRFRMLNENSCVFICCSRGSCFFMVLEAGLETMSWKRVGMFGAYEQSDIELAPYPRDGQFRYHDIM